MDQNFRAIKRQIAWAAAAITLNLSCGKSYDRVDTVKGPKGDQGPEGIPGAQGPKGDKGDTGPGGSDNRTPTPQPTNYPQPTPTLYPQPIPTMTPIPDINLPPLNPYPPIIIINNPPWPTCPQVPTCPSGFILVCACIEGGWKTVSVNVHDVGRLQIKHYGPCTPY